MMPICEAVSRSDRPFNIQSINGIHLLTKPNYKRIIDSGCRILPMETELVTMMCKR